MARSKIQCTSSRYRTYDALQLYCWPANSRTLRWP